MAEEEDGYRAANNREGGRFGRNDGPSAPPMPQNSRFAAAVAADRDYVERGDRGRQQLDHGDRFDRGDDYYDRRGGGRDDDFDGGRYEEPPRKEEPKSSVADLLKPKARPMEENILKVPTKAQADNMLKVPSKDHQDNILKAPSKEKELAVGKSSTPSEPEPPVPLIVDDSELLAEFVSGNKMGDELKTWLEGKGVVPSVEKLVLHLLTETEKLNPDLECKWAEPDQYGAALVSLVEDDLLKQMEVLFAVQKYCDKLGMPKLNDEYVVQGMFRSMYKYDLAGDEAFMMWKEDESPEHEAGKLNAVIQTVDWFNWLEEDDDDDDEDEEE
jgi:hypothetical protein